jgi:Holliday junction resolvasome RuvABC endonuclease subunit
VTEHHPQIPAVPTTGAAGTTPRVVGLDLAAEVTGVAFEDGTQVIRGPKPKGKKRTLDDDLTRLAHIENHIDLVRYQYEPQLVVVEDYAPGIRSAAAHRLAEVGGVVRLALWRAGVPIALVNPMHLKIYATGRSGATKSQMATAAQSRTGLVFPTEDECDAAWLRWMGLDALGHAEFALPVKHREALAKVAWPEVAL